MGIHSQYFALLAGMVLAVAVRAEQWFAIAPPSGTLETALVEIDLHTLRSQGVTREGVIRVTHEVLQLHHSGFGYRSFVATAQFECGRRSMSVVSAAYYPLPHGLGQRLGADSSGRQAGMPSQLLESIPLAARQALVRATCATAPAM